MFSEFFIAGIETGLSKHAITMGQIGALTGMATGGTAGAIGGGIADGWGGALRGGLTGAGIGAGTGGFLLGRTMAKRLANRVNKSEQLFDPSKGKSLAEKIFGTRREIISPQEMNRIAFSGKIADRVRRGRVTDNMRLADSARLIRRMMEEGRGFKNKAIFDGPTVYLPGLAGFGVASAMSGD